MTAQVDWLSALEPKFPRLALGYRYEVQLGKMLDEKQVTGSHLRPYLRNVDVQWGSINTDALPQMDFDEGDRQKFSLREGDILVCEGGEVGRAAVWSGAPGLEEVYYQKALHRLRPLNPRDEHARYMYWCLHAAADQNAYADGGKSTIAHLPADSFRRVRFPKPARAEQERIANLLDKQTARIDALIAAKEELASSLKDIKEVTGFDLVTGGLCTRETRVSHSEPWLAEVPTHWQLSKLRHVATIGNGSTPKRDNDKYWAGGLIPWLNSGAVNAPRIQEASDYVTEVARTECHLPMVRRGSTVVALTGQGKTRGTAALTEIETTINQHLAYVSPFDGRLTDEFLWVALTGFYSVLRYLSEGEGSTKGALTCEQLNQFRLPLPPLEEQELIVKAYLERTRAIEDLLVHAREHVERLREYRSSLISAAVSGQLGLEDSKDWREERLAA